METMRAEEEEKKKERGLSPTNPSIPAECTRVHALCQCNQCCQPAQRGLQLPLMPLTSLPPSYAKIGTSFTVCPEPWSILPHCTVHGHECAPPCSSRPRAARSQPLYALVALIFCLCSPPPPGSSAVYMLSASFSLPPSLPFSLV